MVCFNHALSKLSYPNLHNAKNTSLNFPRYTNIGMTALDTTTYLENNKSYHILSTYYMPGSVFSTLMY